MSGQVAQGSLYLSPVYAVFTVAVALGRYLLGGHATVAFCREHSQHR